jgi:hypothetical protein
MGSERVKDRYRAGCVTIRTQKRDNALQVVGNYQHFRLGAFNSLTFNTIIRVAPMDSFMSLRVQSH